MWQFKPRYRFISTPIFHLFISIHNKTSQRRRIARYRCTRKFLTTEKSKTFPCVQVQARNEIIWHAHRPWRHRHCKHQVSRWQLPSFRSYQAFLLRTDATCFAVFSLKVVQDSTFIAAQVRLHPPFPWHAAIYTCRENAWHIASCTGCSSDCPSNGPGLSGPAFGNKIQRDVLRVNRSFGAKANVKPAVGKYRCRIVAKNVKNRQMRCSCRIVRNFKTTLPTDSKDRNSACRTNERKVSVTNPGMTDALASTGLRHGWA